MSPDRLLSNDAGSVIELRTMVLSLIPAESSHVMMQDQRNRSSPHQQKKKQSETTISNNLSHMHNRNQQQITQSTATSISSITKSQSLPSAIITTTSNLKPSTLMPSSKLLVLQQSPTTYINGNDSTNIGGSILLVATEQMDLGHHNGNIRAISTTNSNNDEELTSLTWLHEKNVLKGNFIGINTLMFILILIVFIGILQV